MKNINYKVLVVDDEYWTRENLRTIIDWQAYSLDFLEPAVDGEDAVLKIEQAQPDILITDINMPFVNGVELLTAVKERYPGIVTIIISGYSDFEYVRQTLLAGAVDYLLKPLTKMSVINVLNKAVEALANNEKIAREHEQVREKLQIASSLLQDKEMSALIAGEEFLPAEYSVDGSIAEMELNLSGFFLVLIKLSGSGSVKKIVPKMDAGRHSIVIKNKVREFVSSEGSMVFNNVFIPNEFILITDDELANLVTMNARIITELEDLTGSIVITTISSHYFSLLKVRTAYQEAQAAYRTKEFAPCGANICFDEAKAIVIKKRIGTSAENELVYSMQNSGKKIFKAVVFDEIGLRNCSSRGWLFIEVRQTVDRIIDLMLNDRMANKSPHELLAVETLAGSMDRAVESFDVAEVCSLLELIIDECFDSSDAGVANDAIKGTVKLVAEYIDGNFFEDISLNSLSKRFLVESTYLSKMFKRYIGENLMLYIARKRIEKATELMKQEGLSLTDISYIVGYDDYAYFNRVFRKITARSPREYKAEQSTQGGRDQE